MANPSLLILPGDGIGAEVMAEVRKVIDWYGAKRGLNFDVSEDLVGGAAYDAHGTPLHDDTMAKAHAADAVLLGAVGGPKYDDLDFSAARSLDSNDRSRTCRNPYGIARLRPDVDWDTGTKTRSKGILLGPGHGNRSLPGLDISTWVAG
jgi:isocitrate/isopropylmalate dehydrogenase